MNKISVFINGFGRIGRVAARILLEDDSFKIVGINDIYSFEQMVQLLKDDSIYGALEQEVKLKGDKLIVGRHKIQLFNQKEPEKLDLKSLDIDVLLQCSGIFLTTQQNHSYIKNGVKKVIISAPACDKTPTYIYGINHKNYSGEEIISNSSCSANAIVPIFEIIEKYFGIKSACMSMIHSYTAYQKLLDVKHYSKDIRRARSATCNIIPLDSSAANETTKFFPHLKDRLYAKSIRVPVASTTLYDLNINLRQKSTLSQITQKLQEQIQTEYSNILSFTQKAAVSSDLVKNPYSATIDLTLAKLQDGDLVQILAWQDNEYGYAKRLIDMAKVVGV